MKKTPEGKQIVRIAVLAEVEDGSVHQVSLTREQEQKLLLLLGEIFGKTGILILKDPMPGVEFKKKGQST